MLKRIARNGLALVAGGTAAQVAFIAIEVLLARELGARAFGIFATTYAVTLLGVFVLDLGTTWWTIQEGSRKRDALPALLGNGLVLKVTFFISAYLIALGILQMVAVPADVRAFASVMALYALNMVMQDSLSAVFTANQKMHVNAAFQGASPVVIFTVYLVLSHDGAQLQDAAWAFVIGGLLVTCTWLLWTVRGIGVQWSFAGAWRMARHGYHYALTGIFGQVFFKADVVMLSVLAGPAHAGVYAAAAKFLDLFYKVPILAGRVVTPALFATSHDAPQSFARLLAGYARVLSFVGVLAGVVTFIAAEVLVALVFGPGYADSVAVLQILSFVMALKCAMVASESLLSSLGEHRVRWTSVAAGVVVNVALNAMLIPELGAIGASIATVASGAVLVALYVARGFQRHKRQAGRWFLLPWVVGALAIFCAQLLSGHILAGLMLAVGLVVAALLAAGFVSRQELGALRAAMPHSRQG